MRYLACLILAVVTGNSQAAAAAKRPQTDEFLRAGKLGEGETALLEHLKTSPTDDEARFGLGALQFIRAVEHLGQSLNRYGTGVRSTLVGEIPFLRLPVPVNPAPQQVTYDLARNMFKDLLADLTRAETTLAQIKDDAVRLRLKLGQIRLDLDSDGTADEPFQAILARYLGGAARVGRAGDFEVAFDRGDVAWLRGYCHLLSALCEFVLAHDARELFEHTAHLFFAKTDSPDEIFTRAVPRNPDPFSNDEIVDWIAFVHLIRFPVNEPERLLSALAHFEQVFALSRESWKFILAETDDDHEWLPNPQQKNGALGVPIRGELIETWLAFIDEAEALFSGKRLVPFWRGNDGRGLNLRKVFTQPKRFDLVLWVQGSAAVPYLEEGPLTKPEVWLRMERIFGGEMLGFALWFN